MRKYTTVYHPLFHSWATALFLGFSSCSHCCYEHYCKCPLLYLHKSLSMEPVYTSTSCRWESLWVYILCYTMNPSCQVAFQTGGSIYLLPATYENANFPQTLSNPRDHLKYLTIWQEKISPCCLTLWQGTDPTKGWERRGLAQRTVSSLITSVTFLGLNPQWLSCFPMS